ncbi:hypothetical protein B296_00020090, partial [Ensete ventricosum]
KSSPSLKNESDIMICPRGTRPSIPCPQVTSDISICPSPPSPSLRRRRLPFLVGSRPSKEQPPLRSTGPGRSRLPLAGSQAMASRPYMGPGHGQPPLHADSMHVAAPPP